MTTNLTPRPLGDDDLEQALRGAFHHGAAAAPEVSDPWTRTTDAVRRSQVRRRTTAFAVAASVALVGVVGTATGSVPFLRADRPTVATPDRRGSDVTVTTDDLRSWPLRGELAGDKAFVAAATGALAEQGSAPQLLFAGRVGDRRVGVGVVDVTGDDGSVSEAQSIAVLEPVSDSEGSAWQPVGPGGTVAGQLTLGLQSRDGSAGLLVLARTDVSFVAYSRAATYDDQGRPRRTYQRLAARDGVATVRLAPGPLTTVSVLVGQDGTPGVPHQLQLWGTTIDHPTLPAQIFEAAAKDSRCTGSIGPLDVQNATVNVWQNRDPLNLPESVRPVWCRDVEGGSVGLFEVTLADGSTFQAGIKATIVKNGGAWSTGGGTPVARGAGRTTPVLLGGLQDDDETKEWRYFVHAPGAAQVQIVVGPEDSDRVLAAAIPGRDGFTDLRIATALGQEAKSAPDGRIVLRDAAGRQVGQLSLHVLEPSQELDWAVTGPVN